MLNSPILCGQGDSANPIGFCKNKKYQQCLLAPIPLFLRFLDLQVGDHPLLKKDNKTCLTNVQAVVVFKSYNDKKSPLRLIQI